MSDKEREIRHQFLDEAQDYLDNLESALIGLAGGNMNVQAVNAAMRSAHSIKGGAGMMGFQLLSQFSHRLEDSLKVLKIQKHTVDVNAELEQLLLTAVDCLRHVALSDRHGESVNSSWLEETAQPIFDALYDRLGEPEEEDAASILSPEDNQDIVPLLFQTEVEGCLERLETLLEGDRHCLYEETEILAQELEALGEMLQLPAFSQLCQNVLVHIQTQPNQIDAVAQDALSAWRQTQRLVLAGHYTELPTDLPGRPIPEAVDTLDPEDFEGSDVRPEVADIALTDVDARIIDAVDTTAGPDADPDVEPDVDPDVEGAAIDGEAQDDDPNLADIATQSWDAAIAQAELVEDGAAETAAFEDWPSESESFSAQEIDQLVDWPEEDTAAPVDAAPVEGVAASDHSNLDTSRADWTDSGAFLPETPEVSEEIIDGDLIERDVADTDAAASADIEYDLPATPLPDVTRDPEATLDGIGSTFEPSIAVEDSGLVDYSDGQRHGPSGVDRPAPEASRSTPKQPRRPAQTPNAAAFQPKSRPEADDATVRIPVRQLKQINNLFSELTIERNGLELYLKRLRALLGTLRHRIKTLDQTNVNLRSAYDRVTTRAELEQASLGTPPLSSAIAKSALRKLPASHALTENFDALELDQYDDMHLMSQEVMETIVQIQEVTTDLELSMDDTDHTFRGLNKTAKQLQTKMTQLQMRPLSDILERFPRALRQMSLEHGKSAELKVYGGNLLIDRNILEALNEPLLHLLRNAFDHGIEDPETRQANEKPAQGTIEIRASHRNSRTIVSIRDDGKGIDLEKIRARARQMGLDDTLLAAASEDELISLIFEPGFSTSSQVTDLSGRGVGMDVVRDGIKQLQGEISVDTQLNQGTTFTLSLPFTLSITRVLLVESNDMMLAFPTDIIEEMTSVSPDQILKGVGGEVLEWEEQVVQFIRLHQWLRFNCPRSLESPETVPNIKESTVLMVSHNDQIVGLQVGRCWGEQEVAIRYVEGNLPMPPGFSSCTILGDGRVVPMVNISELLRWIISDERDRSTSATVAQINVTEQPTAVNLLPGYESPTAAPPVQPAPTTSRKPAVLIVDDSINVRRFLALTLEKAGYRVEQAKDGQDAVDKLTAGLAVQAVLCDIEMPRLDGYGVLARVKSNPSLAQLPIAMLTSRSGDKHRKLAMSLGAAAYFSKPYNEQVLLQSLRQMVELAVAI